MTDHDIQFWTLVTTVVIAVGTFGAAVASASAARTSAKAANTWRDGLRRQRADECIAAAENCAAAIGRTISLKEAGTLAAHPGGLGIDEAWQQWASLRTAIAVFAAYQGTSFDDLIEEGVGIMADLRDFANSSVFKADTARSVNVGFGVLKAQITRRAVGT